VFSVSAVLRNEDGTKDIESMKLPYEGTYVTEFLTEISMLAGWMDRTVSIEYKLARNGREDDADMLVFKIAGYCTQTASTVEEQVLISKRYDISKRRNQLEEIVRQSKFRHTDVRYVGVDDADKTGVVVAYARKTRKSVWTPRFKKAGAVVGTAAVIAAGLLGIQYYQQLEENTVTPEKAKVMACTADNEGLCSLSSRQDDSSNLFSLVMSSGCNDGKPYGSAAKVIECANSLDPAVLERMRQRLFDEMLQNHFVLFLTEQFGATELLRQIESTNRCRTPLSSLIEPLPPYTRRLAEMTLGYFNIAGALDLSATRADIDSLPDSPQSIEPIVNLAYIYNTRGELDEAIRLYGRAASISEATGFTPLPQISLDDILGKLIDAATADRDFNTLNRNLPEFIARADRVTGWGPYALGHVYLRVREYGNAIDKLNLALEQENRMAEPQHDLRGWVSHKLAEVYTETGHFDIAKRYAHESVAAFNITRNPPGMDWSRIALGRVLADTGSLDDAAEAVRVLDNIQETTNDENARIHSLFHQGRAYLRLGDIEEAKELFRIATDNINAYERDSLRKHYDLFLAEYLTGLALVASGGSESNVLPHFRNAEQHLYDLISISESNTEFSAGVKGMFEIEKLACLRFTSRDAYHKRRSELDSSGFILAHQGLFNEFLLDVYGD
jgi:tetratricopeptide (TPR) repeat protein